MASGIFLHENFKLTGGESCGKKKETERERVRDRN